MTPVEFNGCFGWLHRGNATHGHDVAVLICSGLNRDALNAYHAHRLLADQLAQAGYPAMRFDYPQTGDSCDIPGIDENPDINLWAIWLETVNAAVDILRRRTGARRVILMGLRIGSTLAACAAADRNDIAGLVLLSPVIKGHSYLRQLWIEAQLHDHAIPPLGEGLRLQELYFNPISVCALGGVDLRQLDLPAGIKIAVFAQNQGRLIEDCLAAWRKQGADVVCAGFEGLAPLLTLNIEDDKAHPNFEHVLAWVQTAIPAGALGAVPLPAHDTAVRKRAGWIETPLQFGAGGRLFGMLCQPEGQAVTDIMLLVNAGRDPRHAPGRFSVEVARMLARDRLATFRLDFAGLGDSLGPPGAESMLSPLLDLDRSADVTAAIDALSALGFQHFAAYGLCAGAYHAMQAALADPRITRLLLINLPLFSWNPGYRSDFIRHRNKPLRYYLAAGMQLGSWRIARRKLLKSGSVLKGQLSRLGARLAQAPWSPARLLHAGGKLSAGQRKISLLARRNVKTLLLYGQGDLGLDAVAQDFGPPGAAPRFAGNVTMQVLPDFDHLVSHERTRRLAAQSLRDFLRQTRTSPANAPAAETPVSDVNMTAGLV